MRELGHGVDHVASVVLVRLDGLGTRLRHERAMCLDELAIGQGDASSFRLTALAADLALPLLIVAIDLVRRELVEQRGEVVRLGAEGFEDGRQELALEVLVRQWNTLGVAEDTKRLGVDVDLLPYRVGDGRAARGGGSVCR